MEPNPQGNMTKGQRIFNYRLSRTRRIGILAQRFRYLLTTMAMAPEKVVSVVMDACVLHNLIMTRYPRAAAGVDREDPNTHEVIRGTWRDEIGEE